MTIGCDNNAETYTNLVNSWHLHSTELPYQAIVIAAQLLEAPITVLVASSLDTADPVPRWTIEGDSLPGRSWQYNQVNPGHILLVWYNGHYNATVLDPPVKGEPRLRPMTTPDLLLEYPARGDVGAYLYDQEGWIPRGGLSARTWEEPVPWKALHDTVRQTGGNPDGRLLSHYFRLFGVFNFDATKRHPNPDQPKPVTDNGSLIFMRLVETDPTSPIGPPHRPSIPAWNPDPEKVVVVVPYVWPTRHDRATVWTVLLTAQRIRIFAPFGIKVWRADDKEGDYRRRAFRQVRERVAALWAELLTRWRTAHAAHCGDPVPDAAAAFTPPPAPVEPLCLESAHPVHPRVMAMHCYNTLAMRLWYARHAAVPEVDDALLDLFLPPFIGETAMREKITLDLLGGRILGPAVLDFTSARATGVPQPVPLPPSLADSAAPGAAAAFATEPASHSTVDDTDGVLRDATLAPCTPFFALEKKPPIPPPDVVTQYVALAPDPVTPPGLGDLFPCDAVSEEEEDGGEGGAARLRPVVAASPMNRSHTQHRAPLLTAGPDPEWNVLVSQPDPEPDGEKATLNYYANRDKVKAREKREKKQAKNERKKEEDAKRKQDPQAAAAAASAVPPYNPATDPTQLALLAEHQRSVDQLRHRRDVPKMDDSDYMRAKESLQSVWLRTQGLKRYVKRVYTDGDDLYASLAALLDIASLNALVIRAGVVCWLRENPTTPIPARGPGSRTPLVRMGSPNYDTYLRDVVAPLSGPQSRGSTWFCHVAADLLGVNVACVDAHPVQTPSRWSISPLTDFVWEPFPNPNPNALLLVQHDGFFDPAIPDLFTFQAPHAHAFTVQSLSDMVKTYLQRMQVEEAEAAGAGLARPSRMWAVFPTYWPLPQARPGPRDPAASAFMLGPELTVRDVLTVCDPTQPIPWHVLCTLLSLGWQLSWSTLQDPKSIHRPPASSNDVFILPALLPQHREDARALGQFLDVFLHRATGGIHTAEMLVVVPIVLDDCVFTACLTSKSVQVHEPYEPTDEDDKADSLRFTVTELQRAWATKVQQLWRRSQPDAPSLTRRQQDFLREARDEVPRVKNDVWNPKRESWGHPSTYSLALYYAIVACARSYGKTQDPTSELVRKPGTLRELWLFVMYLSDLVLIQIQTLATFTPSNSAHR